MLACSLQRPQILLKIRQFSSSMASPSQFDKILWPPREVQGMVEMDKQKFRKFIEFPCVEVPDRAIKRLVFLNAVREFMLERLPRLKSFKDVPELKEQKLLMFDPDKFQAADDAKKQQLLAQITHQIDSTPDQLELRKFPYQMEFEDWDKRRCICAVLPEGLEFSGFEQCGHIIHVNLREDLLPFRFVIGQILLEKVGKTRTVVNKLDMLSNEFRVMDLELLAGEADYCTEVVEYGIRYKLDYSKVFWNSRLCTVHQETVTKFDAHSVVFDVFAGIGPFVLPAVKNRGVKMAFANDLNPAAIEFLRSSMKANKIYDDRVETFVLDGADFIRTIIPTKIAQICAPPNNVANGEEDDEVACRTNFHVVMNLPGHSADQLPHFRGILCGHQEIRPKLEKCPFWVHCHFFIKAEEDLPKEWYQQEARRIVRTKIGIPDLEIQELTFNRKVAGRKDMYCARIRLPVEFLFEEPQKPEEKAETRKRDIEGAEAMEKLDSNGIDEGDLLLKKQRVL